MESEIIDCVEVFKNYYDYICEDKELYTKKEYAYIWLCELFADFYDGNLDLKWGKLLYKTIKAVLEDDQMNMINNDYENYLICLQFLGENNLDWGSSIRFAWFNDRKKFENYIKQIDEVDNE